jgi:hypothetical protein
MSYFPARAAFFSVSSGPLWAAVDAALSDDRMLGEQSRSGAQRALAAFIGLRKPDYVGVRWRQPVTSGTASQQDDEDDDEATTSPMEALIGHVGESLTWIGSVPRFVDETVLHPLGIDAETASSLVRGKLLAHRLHPAREPWDDPSFPAELSILDQPGDDKLRLAAASALATYARASEELATEVAQNLLLDGPGDAADRLVFMVLCTLQLVADRAADPSTEILVATVH